MLSNNSQKPIILIVDDVPKNIQVLGTLLAKFDCELAIAMNGKQALDTVDRIKPDLILLDVMMPIMDGHETCKNLKENDKTKDIPVIFLSAKTETEDIIKGFKLGAVDYVTKPFIGKELVARVKTHLALKKTKDILNDEIASKNKFFSIISHDLRGAFGIIMSFVEIIQTTSDILSQEEIDELLSDIGSTSKNTLELLENLVRWARSQSGSIKFTPENINIQALFDEITESHKNIAQAKHIQINSQSPSKSDAYGDWNMVNVVLRNLISNAIKYTGVNGQISMLCEDFESGLRITVSDSGIGIDAELIDKLFTIETKVSTQGTENEQGNGLGLVLCREFVKRNNGEIGVESTPGKGTKIWFTIPKV